MSDGTERSWWQASDGRWYPPSAHPDARAQADASSATQPVIPQFVPHLEQSHLEQSHLGQLPREHRQLEPPQLDRPYVEPAYPGQPNVERIDQLAERHAPFRGPYALPMTAPAPAFTSAQTHYTGPHPFAGMGELTGPAPLHPVPAYHSEPLPQLFAGQPTPPPAPAWHQPSSRQSPWPWVAIVAGILVLIPVIWFGSAQLRKEPAKPASIDVKPGAQQAHLQAGANPVTATGPLSADAGKSLYSDDFRDPKSGWADQHGLFGTTVAYGPNGLTVAPSKWGTADLTPPYRGRVDQVSIAVTGTVDATTSGNNGFGVKCTQTTTNGDVEYDFGVTTPSEWTYSRVERVSTNASVNGTGGTSATAIGSTPVTAVAVCATLPDASVRVALFVNGASVMDQVEHPQGLSNTGWTAAAQVTSADGAPPVSLRKFEVRNLAP